MHATSLLPMYDFWFTASTTIAATAAAVDAAATC